MKKILVVDESALFRDYLGKKLTEFGFEVFFGVNGLDGSVKLRNETPDLVIMDYYLTRNSSLELLQKKKSDPNTAPVPVIMVSAKVDRDKIREVAQYNVRKFFTKPVKIDSLLKAIGELLGVSLTMDNTPCIIEAHYNDEILFVEVAEGLNKEKIELLRYKIAELVDLYEVTQPKVLVMMSNINIQVDDSLKLGSLFSTLTDASKVKHRFLKILTNSDVVAQFIRSRPEYGEVEVTNSLERAMDGLLGRKPGGPLDAPSSTPPRDVLKAATPKKDREESIHLRFESEEVPTTNLDLADMDRNVSISVVDDDLVIQELIKAAFADTDFHIKTYDNGRLFLEDTDSRNVDLIFLDLMMPEVDGFQVMESLSEQHTEAPIIVLSALSKRETVMKALRYGVTSYLIKPLRPDGIRRKAVEILRMNF